jgi:Cu-Zn family superoxide dismutase
MKPIQVVLGAANFVQLNGKVRVTASVSGLKPNGQFGFHIHEGGDCSSGDGMSAKDHFNPLAKPHGHHSTVERHAGDMPNLQSDASGNASMTADLDVITVTSATTSIVGRGLIVHVQPDDYKSQPVGNAGARSACAVIQRS